MPALTRIPDQEFLRECFDYDPLAGDLIWKARPRAHFKSQGAYHSWNTKNAGKRAGSPNPVDGYWSTKINGRLTRNHRIIWKLVHNEEPEIVDHINRDRLDNRLVNLRGCLVLQNAKNRTVKSTSSTGVKGVQRRKNRFVAYIQSDRKFINLGSFKSLEEAASAHRVAAAILHGQFASVG